MRKKIYSINVILVFTLLLLSIQSFAISIDNNIIDQNLGLYLSAQYKPSISHFKNFSVQEVNKKVDLIALKNDVTHITEEILKDPTNFNTHYSAKFKNSFTGFSGAVGYYSAQGPRLEVEGFYENFDITDCSNCTINDANRYLALAREKDNNQVQPKAHDSSSTDSNNSSNNTKKSYFTFMKNNGISIASVMINGCYDFSLNNIKISPYVCAGIGGDFIEFFEVMHIKFSYQGKLGVSYLISPSISLFVDGYYHSVINNKFKNLHVTYAYILKDSPTITSAIAQLNIGYFGGEVGLRFVF
uniref:Omp-1-6 n=1 Tax=Ehrlichia ewingii TaxID=947 RepID=B1N6A9_9RICK|nr:Omp-1-6 [Ehrlichia ewingii]